MSTAQSLYKKLIISKDSKHHLILADLFLLVFGRKLSPNEWGLFRKILRIYGSETMYWALLSSAQATGPNPLAYVFGVCKGIVREGITKTDDTMLEINTAKCLNELKRIREELI